MERVLVPRCQGDINMGASAGLERKQRQGGKSSTSHIDNDQVVLLAALVDDAEADMLALVAFPGEHRTKIHSTNPLGRWNSAI